MEVVHAENGQEGIDLLKVHSGHRSGVDGHHDAGDGWLRSDHRNSPDGGV